MTAAGNHDVLRLEIAMHDSALVRAGEAVGNGGELHQTIRCWTSRVDRVQFESVSP